MEASEEDKLPESEIIAQISYVSSSIVHPIQTYRLRYAHRTITFAAMDTTSNALSRILYLLSIHPDVQNQLRQEIREARIKAGGDVGYEALCSLPYLDAVCRETLRV